MRPRTALLLAQVICLALALAARAQDAKPQQPEQPTPVALFTSATKHVTTLVEPPAGAAPQTLTAKVKVTRADGVPSQLLNRELDLAFQAPDRLRLSADINGTHAALGRDGQQLWAHVPGKKFGVIGEPGVVKFSTAPDSKDTSKLGPFKLPLPRDQVAILPLLFKVESRADEKVAGTDCHVLVARPEPQALEALKLQPFTLTLALRKADRFPVRVGYSDGKKLDVVLELHDAKLGEVPAATWQLAAAPGDKIERVALAHLLRFLDIAPAMLTDQIPTLGPATGERRVVATEGAGRLEIHDGTKVLFLKGTPEDMGRQHGVLMKKEVRDLVNRVLYGVGVGSSFDKGRWFFGEIESCQARIGKFIDPRTLREMDALAAAAGVSREEARLANFFPELFHCSGFSLFGDATAGGRMFHGRILDYMKGVGLEQNAVAMVFQPDAGNAWVNVGYAGFVGSVTAMNAKHISIGEMGGRGEGNWDGKPMAQLLREVMEKANTLDEAVEIMRRGPRTCEYYYVISDGRTKRAVGIAATPDKFDVVLPGAPHPQLPHPVKDTVLMSAGDRYEELARRVKAGFGRFDADRARDLMTRPVCMGSNIHSVLFAPDTLDFWVANADSQNPAAHCRYTKYNLAELLKPQPTSRDTGGGR
jgi:hypothetical protein